MGGTGGAGGSAGGGGDGGSGGIGGAGGGVVSDLEVCTFISGLDKPWDIAWCTADGRCQAAVLSTTKC